jgi:hypothetical protein
MQSQWQRAAPPPHPVNRRCTLQYTLLQAVGFGRRANMSLTGFHPLWDTILSQNLQAVADQGCHLEGSSTYKETAYRGLYCISELSPVDDVRKEAADTI